MDVRVTTTRGMVIIAAGILTACCMHAQLEHLIRAGAEIAEQIERARSVVPPDPAIQAQIPAWRAWASARAFELQDTPFGVRGNLAGLPVQAFFARRGRKYNTVAMVGFRKRLGIGFRARPPGRNDLEPWALTPTPTGHADFDRAYYVSAFEAELVEKALNERARQRLIELANEWTEVVVDDYGVLIEVPGTTAPEIAERMLDAAHSAAELVDFVRPERLAAYR